MRTAVADRAGMADGLPDIEIIFASAPYVGEGLVPLPGEGLTVGRDPAAAAQPGHDPAALGRPDRRRP